MSDANHEKPKGGLVKSALAGIGIGQLVHLSLCPAHGLAGVLLKTGVISGSLAAPFVAAHEYLVHDVATPVVTYVRGDDTNYARLPPYRMNRRTRELEPVNPNIAIAHDVVDYSGWGLALGIPVGLVGLSLYRRRRTDELVRSK